ncbi:MAG: 2-hydroxyacid dehydrogenase [Acidobacteriota bacterium]|nr:2-hydroxyacid dehydrogenase [Acidobacteriota bacterium]
MLNELPREAQMVRIPREPTGIHEVDFWILPFRRPEAERVFPHLRGVKVAQSMMAGVDWVTPWLPKEIVLCDARGVHDISTSEWVMAAILSAMKRFPLYRDRQHQAQWRGDLSAADPFLEFQGPHTGHYQLLGEDLEGKTVLIVGYGSIGAAIERRLQPFEVNVLRIARSARSGPEVHAISELHRLLPEADIVVLILPLTEGTKSLIGAAELALLKPGALLVNAARGPVVVTDALVQGLEQRRFRAVLDVTDPEPLPPEHPLWSAPGCMITPHVAGATPQFIHRGFRFAREQIKRYVDRGKLENIVSEAGY